MVCMAVRSHGRALWLALTAVVMVGGGVYEVVCDYEEPWKSGMKAGDFDLFSR